MAETESVDSQTASAQHQGCPVDDAHFQPGALSGRDPIHRAKDEAALKAIAQLAISVEMFTIPLYMNAMYSIKGKHQLTFPVYDGYKGRIWPGLEPTAAPNNANQKAFNSIFGVFIQEMFHMELTCNLASAIGVQPLCMDADDPSGCGLYPLMDENKSWRVYGPNKSKIPGIINLKDTYQFADTKVNLGPLDENALDLFLAIEQPEEHARRRIRADKCHKYFPTVPFQGWQASNGVGDLPMFGSIGHMYACYAAYAGITYAGDDNTTLFELLFEETRNTVNSYGDQRGLQKTFFNLESGGHPHREFPYVKNFAQINLDPNNGPVDDVFDTAIEMMIAIVEQGEGNEDIAAQGNIEAARQPSSLHRFKKANWGNEDWFPDVDPEYQPDKPAMEAAYPSFDDEGNQLPESDDAEARSDFAEDSHYERFYDIRVRLHRIKTWKDWHDEGRVWRGRKLVTDDYVPPAVPWDGFVSPDEMADAMNELKARRHGVGDRYNDLSRMTNGAVYAVVQTLREFWARPGYVLPLGAMRASATRFQTVWAIYGEGPNLRKGIGDPDDLTVLNNACQGLNFDNPGNSCAARPAYHTCAGANSCKTQGACGTVATDCCEELLEPLSCLTRSSAANKVEARYSPPGDNQCKGLGGCAAPISAHQLLRVAGEDERGGAPSNPYRMWLYRFDNPNLEPERIVGGDNPPLTPACGGGTDPYKSIVFNQEQTVYSAAWEAYSEAMAEMGRDPGTIPPIDIVRKVLIPV